MTTTKTKRTTWPWGSGPAPAHNCHVCGRHIGLKRAHFIFEDKVLMCGRCTDWPRGAVAAHDARYPDCPAKGRHDMWDHFTCSATRAGAWFALTRPEQAQS